MNIQSVSADYTIPFIGLATVNHLVLQLNGGKIGYDTFCYRVLQERGLLLPTGLDTHNVLIHLLGDAEPEDDKRGGKRLMINIRFVVFAPFQPRTVPQGIKDLAEQLNPSTDEAQDSSAVQNAFHMKMVGDLLDQQKYRIRITYTSGKVHELHSGVDEAGLELVIKMCDTHILTDAAVRSIEIGSATGPANYWVRGSKRIVYNNYRVGQQVTYMIEDALRALTAPQAD